LHMFYPDLWESVVSVGDFGSVVTLLCCCASVVVSGAGNTAA